jgi:hypothetical protein
MDKRAAEINFYSTKRKQENEKGFIKCTTPANRFVRLRRLAVPNHGIARGYHLWLLDLLKIDILLS